MSMTDSPNVPGVRDARRHGRQAASSEDDAVEVHSEDAAVRIV